MLCCVMLSTKQGLGAGGWIWPRRGQGRPPQEGGPEHPSVCSFKMGGSTPRIDSFSRRFAEKGSKGWRGLAGFSLYIFEDFIYLLRDEGGEREGEKHQCVSRAHHQGPSLQPRHVP